MKRGDLRWRGAVCPLLAATLLFGAASGCFAGAANEHEDPVSTALTQRRFADVVSLAREELIRLEGKQPPDELAMAGTIDQLVKGLRGVGKGSGAETLALARRAVTLKLGHFQPDDPRVALSLLQEACVLRDSGDLAGAEPLMDRVQRIQSAALGNDHLDLAQTLSERAWLAFLQGRFETALSHAARALAIREAELGTRDPRVAASLNNLAIMLKQQGRYEDALEHYKRAREIQEETLGPEHHEIAVTLNNLASLHTKLGAFALARGLYEKAITQTETTLGPDHARLGPLRNNYGSVLQRLGDLDGALEQHRQALAINEAQSGPDSLAAAQAFNNLASIASKKGEPALAEEFLRRVLTIRQRLLGDTHGATAHAMSNLGTVLLELGQIEEADILLRGALQVQRSKLSADHPETATTLFEIGGLERRLGNNTAARRALEETVEIRSRSLGGDHALVAEALAALAEIHWRDGATETAFELALRADAISREHLRLAIEMLAEEEALRYAARVSPSFPLVNQLMTGAPDTGNRSGRVFDSLIRSRALVLDSIAARNGRAFDIARRSVGFVQAGERLAGLLVRGPDGEEPARYRSLIADAKADRERAERVLAETNALFRQERELRTIGLDEVSESLPDDAVLVSFVRYEPIDLSNEAAVENREAPAEASYMAFVLKPGSRSPEVVALAGETQIRALVTDWRREAESAPRAIPAARREAEARYRQAGQALRQIVWDSLGKAMGSAKTILIVPDGAVHLVSFAALPLAGGGYLVEGDRTIHYLSAEREVFRARRGRSSGHGLLAVGGPDYDLGRYATTRVARFAQRGAAACGDGAAEPFPPLPGSKNEVDSLRALWLKRAGASGTAAGSTVELVGAAATEAAVKRHAPGRRVVHLATHGFFKPSRCPDDGTGAGPPSWPAVSPLVYTGLAFSGANRPPVQSAKLTPGEDGVLTAEEIVTLDLSAVEWVVLSGCKTGLGEVWPGEGVLGLRRSFSMAGAGTLIMSLWTIEDIHTVTWMRALYEGRLSGRSTAQAMRQASVQVLAARRELGKSTHPFFWGAFVAVGRWD